MDSNFGLRAEDAAPRSFAPHDSGRGPSTPETRGQACWSCFLPVALQPSRGAIQASTTGPARSALSQHAVTLPASCFASHSIAPQAASASPGHHHSTFFGTSDRLGTMLQGRHTGMKTDYSATTAARNAVLPRVHGPRANLRQEPCRSSRDIIGLWELVYVGSFYPRLPESGPGPLRSAPSLRKQAALDGIGSRNIYIFSSSSLIIQTIYMGFSTGV